jgi:3-oxoacyl-[acyl-carrier-protein] synthase II
MVKQVVVTGLGAITPLGNSVETFWSNLVAGRSGIARISHFDPAAFDSQIAGEVRDFDPSPLLDRKEVRHLDPFVQYSMVAAQQAMQQAGLDLEREDRNRIGVVIGSGIGGIQSLEAQHTNLIQKGPGRVSPFLIPMMIPNMAAGMLAIKYRLGGPNSCPVTACASGNNAFAEAVRWIQHGDADVVVCGGAESAVSPISVAGFCSAKALSLRNAEPERASRPFDKDRDGFVIAEGAGIAVFESLEHARARGARVLAELKGIGMSDDAYHMTAPEPEGQGGARAMRSAVADAGLKPEDIDYINAHGTSTSQGDIAETKAIKSVFGAHARKLAISSTKSMTGHCLGAAGGIEFVAVVKTLEAQRVHPTINLEHPDPECDLDYVPNQARDLAVRHVVSNSFGFGGHNISLVVSRFEG